MNKLLMPLLDIVAPIEAAFKFCRAGASLTGASFAGSATPWMTGLGAMRAARLAGLGTSLIVMTGLRDASIPASVKALGGILLRKPFDSAELEAAATELLAKRRVPAGRTKD